MNKLSGYGKFQTSYGEVEMKFSNGTYEIFGELMGLDSIEEVQESLRPKTKTVVEGGVTKEVALNSFSFLKAMRLFVLAAIRYAALVQPGKECNLNEYQAGEIADEIGFDKITALMNKGVDSLSVDETGEQPTEAKKKPKERLKVTQ